MGEYQSQEEEKETARQTETWAIKQVEKSQNKSEIRNQGKGVLEQQAMLSFWRGRNKKQNGP